MSRVLAAAAAMMMLAPAAVQAAEDAVYQCSNEFSPFHIRIARGFLWDELYVEKAGVAVDGDSFDEDGAVVAAMGDWLIDSGDTIALAGARMQCTRVELNTIAGIARLTCGGAPFDYACRPVPAAPY